MVSFFAWFEDTALKDDYYLQLRAATRHSKSPVDFMEHDTVATKWKSVVDLRHTELEAATKATEEATGEPEAALGAAGADDGAAALARPKQRHRRSCGRRHGREAGGKRRRRTRASSSSSRAPLSSGARC